jgi:hypothetical protein
MALFVRDGKGRKSRNYSPARLVSFGCRSRTLDDMSPAHVVQSHVAMAGAGVGAAAVVLFFVPLIIATRLELRSRKNFAAADHLFFIRAGLGNPQRQAA